MASMQLQIDARLPTGAQQRCQCSLSYTSSPMVSCFPKVTSYWQRTQGMSQPTSAQCLSRTIGEAEGR